MASQQHSCPHTAEVPHSRADRPTYSYEQVTKYMALIGLPDEYVASPIMKERGLAQQEKHALPFLSALMRHHMAKVPFENLALHYSQGRMATLDVMELYERMVERGRGGYCFQQNIFFCTVLRAIGFEVMTTAARVSSASQASSRGTKLQAPSYGPWSHMANIVSIGARDYLIDVGMNALGPVVPIELVAGKETSSIFPRKVRLMWGCVPEYVSRRDSNQMWHFEISNGDSQPWVPTYCFSTLEFLPADFSVLNWHISTSKTSWFTQKVICGRLLLSLDGKSIDGDETIFADTFTKRVHGEVKEKTECQNEQERIALLEERFGIKLLSYERDAIIGTVAQVT